ncbi:uncharacterized protein isoform X2 [Musca autumnalis]|uniref:uncharacterized protein isoform X2 n=1 Tax=Musca autumnalis TaxID=221902 RepID=UPI003CFB4001
MLRINLYMCTFVCAIVLSVTNTILGQESSFFKKPWPTYSLQNMPQTRFTCHDKILGGYYADPETQCQMFHVCVKVGGVGVQDFRFLCPNSTAFDQEAQICANWADVDCFESKRAPLAEEDESTFHLQRAETGDIRRYKQTTVDQKSRPEQPPNYTKQYETATRGGGAGGHHHNNHNYLPNDEAEKQTKKKVKTDVTKKPIVSYYTPTTTTTTERYGGSSDDSKQDLDDIFKGSHSSHFFSNRNGGREDDFVDHPVRQQQKPNDFNDFSKKSESTTSGGKSRVTPTRARRPPATASTTLASTTQSTTAAPKVTKKVTAYYNTDFFDYSLYKSTTTASTTSAPSTVAVTTTKTPQHNPVNRFNFGVNDYQTQLNIQPTTYNPNRLKTSTPKYAEVNRHKGVNNEAFNKKLQKFEQSQQKAPAQNSSFVNLNEFSDFAKIKTQPPQPFQPKAPAKTFEAPKKSEVEPQYYRSRGQHRQPEPFKTAPTRASNSRTTTEGIKERPIAAVPEKPRGFVSRGSINYKATTQRNSETYPTVSAQNYKKFSTLVPKDKYDPTTFKPTTYKKTYDNSFYTQTQQTSRPQNKQQQKATTKALPPTTTGYTTANPYYNIDEDDGQYHPELYEIDFPRNKYNLQRSSSTTSSSSTTTTTTTSKPYYQQQQQSYQNPVSHLKSQQQTSFQKEQSAQRNDFSDEDELFNTAQSLNFGAASINKLRADIIKAEKTSQQYNSHYNPLSSLTSPKTTTSTTQASPSSTSYFTYPAYSYSSSSTQQTTQKPVTYAVTNSPSSTTTSTTTTTTRRPTTSTTTSTTTTTPYPFNITKSGKHADKLDKKSKKNDSKKKTSKRPPHADEDTSYDYAYYDTDTLSESPQEYPEYEFQEFTKTRKN